MSNKTVGFDTEAFYSAEKTHWAHLVVSVQLARNTQHLPLSLRPSIHPRQRDQYVFAHLDEVVVWFVWGERGSLCCSISKTSQWGRARRVRPIRSKNAFRGSSCHATRPWWSRTWPLDAIGMCPCRTRAQGVMIWGKWKTSLTIHMGKEFIRKYSELGFRILGRRLRFL